MPRPADEAVAMRGGPGGGGLRCAATREIAIHAGVDGATACAFRTSSPATRAAGPAGTHPQAPVTPHETPQDNDAPPQGIGARCPVMGQRIGTGVEDSIMGHAQTCWPYPRVTTATSRSVR